MLEALASADARLAANTSIYALPVPLCMDSGSLAALLRTVLSSGFAQPRPGTSPDGQVAEHPCMPLKILHAHIPHSRGLNCRRSLPC